MTKRERQRVVSRERQHKAAKLRTEAGELDQRGVRLSLTMATMDAERVRLFVRAEALRHQAEEMER